MSPTPVSGEDATKLDVERSRGESQQLQNLCQFGQIGRNMAMVRCLHLPIANHLILT